jgi:hypothetical protein
MSQKKCCFSVACAKDAGAVYKDSTVSFLGLLQSEPRSITNSVPGKGLEISISFYHQSWAVRNL